MIELINTRIREGYLPMDFFSTDTLRKRANQFIRFFVLLLITICMLLIAAKTANAASLNKKSIKLKQYSKYVLQLNHSYGKITWRSSNKKIATVSSKGLVKAKKEGACIIYADNLGKTYSCKVKVKPVKLSKQSLTMGIGHTEKLTLKNAEGTVKWGSSSEKVASVSSTGVITANKAGTCNIWAKYAGHTFRCQVEVDSTYINVSKISLEAGSSYQLSLIDSHGKTTWSSSSSKIAKVNSKGLVTAKGEGTCTITAKNGTKKYTCKVTVHAFELDHSDVSIVKLRYQKLTVSGCSGTPRFSSSDPAIASVDNRGIIHANRRGRCTITASYGGISRTCKVTVTAKAEHEEAVLELAEFYSPVYNQNKILLAGSSSLDFWTNAGEMLCPNDPTNVLNMGIAGSMLTEWMNWYSRLIAPYNPSAIILYAGGNDINKGMDGDLNARNTIQLLKWLRMRLPNTPVYYVSIITAPRYYMMSSQEQMFLSNQMMKEYCEKMDDLYYIDIYSRIMLPDDTEFGKPNEAYFKINELGEPDLHPSALGYSIWQEELCKALYK